MKAVIAEKVPFAKYYVQEIATDEHYILNGEKVPCKLRISGSGNDHCVRGSRTVHESP